VIKICGFLIMMQTKAYLFWEKKMERMLGTSFVKV